MKALDFVKTPKGAIALVSETNPPYNGMPRQVSISYIGPSQGERNAWWNEDQLEVIDSLPRLLAAGLAHPFGQGKKDVKRFFRLEPDLEA